jgi:hypothetical protein
MNGSPFEPLTRADHWSQMPSGAVAPDQDFVAEVKPSGGAATDIRHLPKRRLNSVNPAKAPIHQFVNHLIPRPLRADR